MLIAVEGRWQVLKALLINLGKESEQLEELIYM